MNTQTNLRLSGNQLKILAIIFMFIDHASFGLLHTYLSVYYMNLQPQTYTRLNSFYEACRGIGRLAFPIFCFFLVEGFLKTHNIKKYTLRLLIFAIVSEIPFDLGLYRKVIYTNHQNVMFTLLAGLIMLIIIKYVLESIIGLSDITKWICVFCTVVGFADLTFIMKTDYSFKGILIIAALYLLRRTGALRLLAGAAITAWSKYAPISFLLMYFYDPEVKPRFKYFFYLFYPAHLLLIFLIGLLLFR